MTAQLPTRVPPLTRSKRDGDNEFSYTYDRLFLARLQINTGSAINTLNVSRNDYVLWQHKKPTSSLIRSNYHGKRKKMMLLSPTNKCINCMQNKQVSKANSIIETAKQGTRWKYRPLNHQHLDDLSICAATQITNHLTTGHVLASDLEQVTTNISLQIMSPQLKRMRGSLATASVND